MPKLYFVLDHNKMSTYTQYNEQESRDCELFFEISKKNYDENEMINEKIGEFNNCMYVHEDRSICTDVVGEISNLTFRARNLFKFKAENEVLDKKCKKYIGVKYIY